MDYIVADLGISEKNIFTSPCPLTFSVVVHYTWLKYLLKDKKIDYNNRRVNNSVQLGESVSHPWRKIFIKIIEKKHGRVLPLPRSKITNGKFDSVLSFSQLLQYVAQTNQRNVWKEAHKRYTQPGQHQNPKDNMIVNLHEYDILLSEVIMRLYGCEIIKVKNDPNGIYKDYAEVNSNKHVLKSYETQNNLLPALCALESDKHYYIIFNTHIEHNLLDCLTFSPAVLDSTYARGLFIIYQLLQTAKAMCDRGLTMGDLTLQNIYLTENLWLQINPVITNNLHLLEPSLVHEQVRSKIQNCGPLLNSSGSYGVPSPHSARKKLSNSKATTSLVRDNFAHLEKMCDLWVRGRISNLDYIIHLNELAGRKFGDPQTHYVVPWVTDFTSRCGNYRDLTKSKYRLTKGDRQLDMTYDVMGKDTKIVQMQSQQIPHHVSDVLSDITYYVYMARRTQKEVLCRYVRNNWVAAEYPISIQRMQEWTPDECIPEFYTEPSIFKSIHEDLPDLEVPSWASCAEDFVAKHREALESTFVSDNLHHWIDLTFGYKLSGPAAVKAKNVCLSLVDNHRHLRRGGAVQLLSAQHPVRQPCPPPPCAAPAPPRIYWTKEKRKILKTNDSSDDLSEDEEESTNLPQHMSRLSAASQSEKSKIRNISTSRTRPQSKSLTNAENEPSNHSVSEAKSSSTYHSRYFKVQKSEVGKGIIYLPKEYNPITSLLTVENYHNFKIKSFYNSTHRDNSVDCLNLPRRLPFVAAEKNDSIGSGYKGDINSDEHSFTNHMFVASYEHTYYRRANLNDSHLDNGQKDKKNRSFNNRFTTDAAIYKQFMLDSRRHDIAVIGCLAVEIFLYQYFRPLRTVLNSDFQERYDGCRLIFKHNYSSMPKCLSYVVGLLLNVEAPSYANFNSDILNFPIVEPDESKSLNSELLTDKGLPPPTPSQLLQPLLASHLTPFPVSFSVLYNLITTLHEFNVTSRELNIFCVYECDGLQCSKYQNADKTKLTFDKKIAEGKIYACSTHLDTFINRLPPFNQFDVVDLFLPHYIELLDNKDTAILAAWYLFDTVSKALGPVESCKKLLKRILQLYDYDLFPEQRDSFTRSTDSDVSQTAIQAPSDRRKSVKLYHNIFLLQLIVRFGMRCFLENFTQHLVEAVGGYKDSSSTEALTPLHSCHSEICQQSKKIRCNDETMKVTLSANSDILSPDTSYGSEHVLTPGVERNVRQNDTTCDTEVFHFENEPSKHVTSILMDNNEAAEISSISSADNCEAINHNIIKSVTDSTKSDSPNVNYIRHFREGVEFNDDNSNNSPYSVKSELELVLSENAGNVESLREKGPISPTIDIPSKFHNYNIHINECDGNSLKLRKEKPELLIDMRITSKSLDLDKRLLSVHIDTERARSFQEETHSDINEVQSPDDSKEYKISEMSSESLIWLAHRLGPVLTCRYVTRNLLKMLTLCYFGKENLVLSDKVDYESELQSISIANCVLVGDNNAIKVINCLTSIVALYGEQLILFQYLPHMGDLIASCRNRLSAPLEGGLVACLQLLCYLIPFMSDIKLMDQLQDVILKNILHPTVRLLSTTRSTFPSGSLARSALARKFLDALYVLAVRIGPDMTKKHLCVPALQRFFLAFDKASGKTENWPKTNCDASTTSKCAVWDALSGDEESRGTSSYLEICRDGSVAEWCVSGGLVRRAPAPHDRHPPCSSPPQQAGDETDRLSITAQEELRAVFNAELAHQAFLPFYKFVGAETMERSLKNTETIHAMCHAYDQRINKSCHIQHPFSDTQPAINEDGLSKKTLNCNMKPLQAGINVHLGRADCLPTNAEEMPSCNSFGSNVTLVGNRIEVSGNELPVNLGSYYSDALDIVSCKIDNGNKNNRHLRGDWLIYWEHEIGRPDKENRFNLKQIKLQTFAGHSHAVKAIYCLDNENSFMTASKDKTVRLWSLRNQGDGSAVSQCQWTYSGHKKGVLSLTFLESLRLAVSTDSVVHIWDPYMESVVAQLDKSVSVSLVKAMPAPSPLLLAATTDALLRLVDARTCTYTHDLKVTNNPNTFIRCMCVSPSGTWVGVGLASGAIAVLDLRTGLCLCMWRAHDGEVLQLVCVNEQHVISTGLDQTMSVWSVHDGKLSFHLKGTTEPVHCLSVYHNEVISGTTNNRIGVHTDIHQDAGFSSTKLRSDTFRGVLTSMAVLPLNRLLLLGGDSGNVTLLC